MTLSPDQKQAVATWVAAGDTLAAIQKKLADQFKLSLTYMDVRFLVDDLGLVLKSAAPKSDAGAELSRAQPPAPAEKKGGILDRLKKAVGGSGEAETGGAEPEAEDGGMDELEPEPAGDLAGASKVKVEVDRIVRPGAVVSGNVTFSDGVSGKWAMDQYGRLMLDLGRKGYQPSAADVQVFQRELSRLLQQHGY